MLDLNYSLALAYNMATFTLNYKARKKPVPVIDQIEEDSETVLECLSEMNITITPTGTKYLEIIENAQGGASVYADKLDGNISSTTNVQMIIDAHQSFQSELNIYSSSITVRVRDGIGGTIEDSITMYRDHNALNC